ncbi:MAG: glycosyltransferase [Ignavibacteria bacterium]|jgi:glycosyltransferase involved in cell wall biosynthesis|nr:glycosyltransferase [Ignavibacteria bacterium]MDH7527401.1 glycosyltransferase [Ignavibacteria bacterium]
MKILLVITKSEIGGAQVFVLNLAKSLKKLGVDVQVAAGEGNFLFNELPKYNIPYFYLKSLKRDISIFNAFYYIFDLYKLLKKNDFDIIHLNSTNTLLGTISANLLKKKPKIIFTFHGLSLLDKNYKSNPILKLLSRYYFKLLVRLIDKSIFVSELNYKEAKQYKLVNDGEIIYNGLCESELSFLSREDAIKFFSTKCNCDLSNFFLIGSVARLSYPKNYEFLILNYSKIKKAIPESKVIIIGDGPNFNLYQKMIKKLGIENDFFLVGAIKNSYQYIKAFDVFTLPSFYEGLSISLIEAIFAEIPILASDVGGNREIVDNNYDQLYQLDNIEEYISKLIKIKNNKSQYQKYNANLKKRFSLQEMTDKYYHIYKNVLINNK